MQKFCIDSPTASIPSPHFAHSFHTISNSASKFTIKKDAPCTSETLFHICQTTRRHVAEISESSLLCTDMSKDLAAAITTLVDKIAIQWINFILQGANFMLEIAACTVNQMFMADLIAWLQETVCLCACVWVGAFVPLLRYICICYPALHPEGRRIRFVGLSRCVWLCVSLHFEHWQIWQISLSSVYEELLYLSFQAHIS